MHDTLVDEAGRTVRQLDVELADRDAVCWCPSFRATRYSGSPERWPVPFA